jgi:hypothetical protein
MPKQRRSSGPSHQRRTRTPSERALQAEETARLIALSESEVPLPRKRSPVVPRAGGAAADLDWSGRSDAELQTGLDPGQAYDQDRLVYILREDPLRATAAAQQAYASLPRGVADEAIAAVEEYEQARLAHGDALSPTWSQWEPAPTRFRAQRWSPFDEKSVKVAEVVPLEVKAPVPRVEHPRVERPSGVKGHIASTWSEQADARLVELVAEHGTKVWGKIAADIPGRTGKQ